MPQKHILFLASWYPSRILPFSGDFIQRHAIAAGMKNKITVLHAIKDDVLRQKFEISERNNSIREIIVYYRPSRLKFFNFIRRFVALKKGYKKAGRIDLVHLNTCYPAGIFALFLHYFQNKKYVLSEHWTSLHPDKYRLLGFQEKIFIPHILKNAEKWLPVSNNLAKNMAIISRPKSIDVIPNVVDTTVFKPCDSSPNSKKIRFLHLSMLSDAHKNIGGMLRVIKRLSDKGYSFEFHIGGNGPLDQIKEFIELNKLSKIIYPFGELAHKDVPRFMASFDCFVLFSNFENQPCVQAETLSCGVPLVASDVGGIGEFLPADFGILVTKGNEDALFTALESIIQGRQFASKQELHDYAERNFSPNHIANRLDQLYNTVIHEG
ncbi:MAG: glycosyltransferase [Saprospiraceae bacterium]|nr:glycosyltransferase [Saprospiraceae bacterium]